MSQNRWIVGGFLVLYLTAAWPISSLGNECQDFYTQSFIEESNVILVDFRARKPKRPVVQFDARPTKNQEPEFLQDNLDYLKQVQESIEKTSGKDLTRNDVFVIQSNISIIRSNIRNYADAFVSELNREISKLESLLENYDLNFAFDPAKDRVLRTLPGKIRSDLGFLETHTSLIAANNNKDLEGFSIFHLDYINRYKNKQLRLRRIKYLNQYIELAITNLETAYKIAKENPDHYDLEPLLNAANSVEKYILNNPYFEMIMDSFSRSFFAKYKTPAKHTSNLFQRLRLVLDRIRGKSYIHSAASESVEAKE